MVAYEKIGNTKVIKGTIVPYYIIDLLDRYNNALIGRRVVMKYGYDGVKEILEKEGYVVEFDVIVGESTNEKYPKDASYVLNLKRKIKKSESLKQRGEEKEYDQ